MKTLRHIILAVVLMLGIGICQALEPWGIVKLSVAHVRSAAGHANEMVTQATMGTPLKQLAEQSDWVKVELPDGYTGWISKGSVRPMSQKQFDAWRSAERVVVVGKGHRTSTEMMSVDGAAPVSDLDRLDILEVVDKSGDELVIVKTPDGREGVVPADEVVDMDLFFRRGEDGAIAPDADIILSNARDMLGRVYLWGGTSFKMTDCSGLTRICYMMNGILLPRDASPQSKVGKTVSLADAQPGDLVFFANDKGRVNHVGIYMGDKRFIHSSGQVRINSLDPKAPDRYYKQPHVIKHYESTDVQGLTKIADHPWYFLTNN